MPEDSKKNNRILLGIGLAIAVWGVVLAIGAWLGTDQPGDKKDFRKFAIVAGCSGSFLLFWFCALYFRKRRLEHEKEIQNSNLTPESDSQE